jgi:lipopolysaccharide biosynthesis glycosyltransferase
VVDLDVVRREKLFTKAADFVLRCDPELNDQDALNWACWGRWKRFDVAWNAQRHMAIPSLIETMTPDKRLNGRHPNIIHFTGPEKPWKSGVYHPWSWLYWKSLKRTSFTDEVAARNNVSRFERVKVLVRFLRRWNWLSA